jgi:sugar lactone lactonase YvrE
MVLKKTIIQVYSGNETFGFEDFVGGTLRLLNFAIDTNINLRLNIVGSEFEEYLLVDNYNYDTNGILPRIFYNNQRSLLDTYLFDFINNSESLLIITSSVALERNDIYGNSFRMFQKLVNYNPSVIAEVKTRLRANLLNTNTNDNLINGYSVIYVEKDPTILRLTQNHISSLANQIKGSINLNRDITLVSNSIQLAKILISYIKTGVITTSGEVEMDTGIIESFPSPYETIINFLLLLNSKKIYRFTHKIVNSHHIIPSIKTTNLQTDTNFYDTVTNMNIMLGNVDVKRSPLYYNTSTIIGSSPPNISVLNNPSGMAQDNSGNIYVADTNNHRICKLDASGNLYQFAGSSTSDYGFINGNSLEARFNLPSALALDNSGNIYVADSGNNSIRIIETTANYDSSNNIVGFTRRVNTLIDNLLNNPMGIAIDRNNNTYVADTNNHRICRITGLNKFVVIAGPSNLNDPFLQGFTDGTGIEAKFNYPTGICTDFIGNIYVADRENNLIRKITSSGNVSTIAGNGLCLYKNGVQSQASFNNPRGVTVDRKGNIYVADSGNNSIRYINTTGVVSLVVGSINQKIGSNDGTGEISTPHNIRASLHSPSMILSISSTKLYFTDSGNNTLRSIDIILSDFFDTKFVPIQTFQIINSTGVTYTLGPSLRESQTVVPTTQGRRRGMR